MERRICRKVCIYKYVAAAKKHRACKRPGMRLFAGL